jgi:hypothetical protein
MLHSSNHPPTIRGALVCAPVVTVTVLAEEEPTESVDFTENVYEVEGLRPLMTADLLLVVTVEGPPVIV